MKKLSIDDIKQSKPFKWFDLIIYGIVLLLILGLFMGFVIFPNKNDSDGFYVYFDNELALTYYYSNSKCDIQAKYNDRFIVDGDSIKIWTNSDKTNFNTIKIDKTNQKVVVTDANCQGKDCERLSVVKDSGAIICTPHKLKIVPISNKSPIIG